MAAASSLNKRSHSGVLAGVSSEDFKPKSRRKGGKTIRFGAGGVTRSSQ